MLMTLLCTERLILSMIMTSSNKIMSPFLNDQPWPVCVFMKGLCDCWRNFNGNKRSYYEKVINTADVIKIFIYAFTIHMM